MWPRHIEVMLACWLAITPFVFAGTEGSAVTDAVSWASASAVIFFSLISYWPRARRAYLGTGLTGLVMAAWGYFSASVPAAPIHQNFIVTGLLLVMFGIIPCYNNTPPKRWNEYRPD